MRKDDRLDEEEQDAQDEGYPPASANTHELDQGERERGLGVRGRGRMKATHPKPKKKVDGMKKTTRCSTIQYIILAGHKAVWTMTRGLEKSEAPTVRSEIEMWKIAVAKATRKTNARAMQSRDC